MKTGAALDNGHFSSNNVTDCVKSAQNTETHWFRQVFSRFTDNRQPYGYGASEHAMAGFFDSLRIELVDSGSSVTTIYPGWVSTGISSRALRVDGNLTGEISVH
jgi:NAD(P)-dependent dehydrogenase (short-subunit alcohol dehydrogenase family)